MAPGGRSATGTTATKGAPAVPGAASAGGKAAMRGPPAGPDPARGDEVCSPAIGRLLAGKRRPGRHALRAGTSRRVRPVRLVRHWPERRAQWNLADDEDCQQGERGPREPQPEDEPDGEGDRLVD